LLVLGRQAFIAVNAGCKRTGKITIKSLVSGGCERVLPAAGLRQKEWEKRKKKMNT
jgi:hypothetical protein